MDAGIGALHLLRGLLYPVQHHPVHKKPVEEIVRKAHEAVNAHLHTRGRAANVGQLRPEAAQLALQQSHVVLGAVQVAMLGQVRDEPAAEEVKGSPALSVAQFVEYGVYRVQGVAARGNGLHQLLLAALLRRYLRLYAQKLAPGLAAAAAQLLCPSLERALILLMRALKFAQLCPEARYVVLRLRQLPRRRLILQRRRSSLPPLLVQLFLALAQQRVEKCGKPACLQALHIGPLVVQDDRQLLDTRLQRAPLRLQLAQLGPDLRPARRAALQLLQFSVVYRHVILLPPFPA